MSARIANKERCGSDRDLTKKARTNMTCSSKTCSARLAIRHRRNDIRKLCVAYCKTDRRDVRTRFDQIKCLCAELSFESLARPEFFCPLVCAVLDVEFDPTDIEEWRLR